MKHWVPITVAAAMFFSSQATFSAERRTQDWGKLLAQGKTSEVRSLCSKMINSPNPVEQVEGNKCLANVELSGKSLISLQKDDAGGGTLSSAYDSEAAEKAIKHLDAALKIAPEDLSIHQGRLHILEVQTRYSDMAKALEESATLYRGDNALDAWLAYIAELHDLGQYRAAIGLLEVLDKHYPNSNLVIGDFGAMYLSLNEDEKGLRFLKRAVEIKPTDPIDNWNLARAYDFMGKDDLAKDLYPKAISLANSEEKRGMNCYYSHFVDKKLKDPVRACALQKQNCDKEDQTACDGARK
jgi:tetratricopeptide (TPR) repeat protein